VIVGVSTAVIPATYKKKKAPVSAPKVEEDGEKPAATTAAVEGEGEAPTAMGRGTRWMIASDGKQTVQWAQPTSFRRLHSR